MKRTKEEAQETRSAILEAAERVFSKLGFSETTLVNIAEEAGMTRGAIYWHFKDKDELFSELLSQGIGEVQTLLYSIFDSDMEPMQKLRKIINTVISFILEKPDMTAFDELLLFQKDWEKKHSGIYQIFTEITEDIKSNISKVIRKAIQRGEIRKNLDQEAVEIAILSLLGGIKSTWVRSMLPDNPDPDKLTDIIINGIAEN